MLELSPLFLRTAAVEVLGKNLGQVLRGFANVYWLVKGTNIPDNTSCPHLIGICRRVYFVLVQTCADGSCRKSVQLQFPPIFATDVEHLLRCNSQRLLQEELWMLTCQKIWQYWMCLLWAVSYSRFIFFRPGSFSAYCIR
jgi:hypothetical protein